MKSFLMASLPILTLVIAVIFVANHGISVAEKIVSAQSTETAAFNTLKNGTWVFYRGTATVEWCENVLAAYEYHDQIAEFFNSISNLAFVIVAILGLHRIYDSHSTSSKKGTSQYPPLPFSFAIAELVMLVGVGFGSAIFHAHQSRFSQLADELPMSMLVLTDLHCLRGLHPLTTDPKYSRLLYRYNHATVAFFWVIYLYTHLHEVFLLCFVLQIVYNLAITFDSARRMKQSQTRLWYAVLWLTGAKVLWDMERHRYEDGACDAPYTIWLHPLWHVGSGISHYYSQLNMADLVKTAQLLETQGKKDKVA